MKRFIAYWAVALGLLSATAQGGFMTRTGVQGSTDTLGNPLSDFWNDGGVTSSSGGANLGANAFSSVNLIADPGIKLTANTKSGGSYGYANNAIAAGNWLDVIRVSGGTAPTTLRVTLAVSGKVELIRGTGVYSSQARVGVAMVNVYSPFGNDSGVPNAGGTGWQASEVQMAAQAAPYGDYFRSQNTENLSYDEFTGKISWDAVFDLTYNATLGGYLMNAYATASSTSSSGAISNVDFGHTIRLTQVTNTDGSDVDGDLTFDSGFRLDHLEEVPAPPAVVLAAIGTFGLFGVSRFRRLRMLAGPQPA